MALRWGKYPGLCNSKSPYKQKREAEERGRRGRQINGSVRTQLCIAVFEDGRRWAKEDRQPLGAGKGMKIYSPLEPPEVIQTHFRILTVRTIKYTLTLSCVTKFVIYCCGNKKLMHRVKRKKRHDHPLPIATPHISSTVVCPKAWPPWLHRPGSPAFWLLGYQTMSRERCQDSSSPTLSTSKPWPLQ